SRDGSREGLNREKCGRSRRRSGQNHGDGAAGGTIGDAAAARNAAAGGQSKSNDQKKSCRSQAHSSYPVCRFRGAGNLGGRPGVILRDSSGVGRETTGLPQRSFVALPRYSFL